MDIKKYTKHLTFTLSFTLFLMIGIYTMIVYFGWVSDERTNEYEVEVTLPVIDWQKYSNLSKNLNGDKIKVTK